MWHLASHRRWPNGVEYGIGEGAGQPAVRRTQQAEGSAKVWNITDRHPESRKTSARLFGPPFAPAFGVNGQISARVGMRDLALPNSTTIRSSLAGTELALADVLQGAGLSWVCASALAKCFIYKALIPTRCRSRSICTHANYRRNRRKRQARNSTS